jgi:ABC-type dipeptide/oligopeptide/nickel transport system ATPase subunit
MNPIPSAAALRTKADKALALRSAAERRVQSVKTEIKALEDQEAKLDLVSELFRQLIDEEVTTGVQAVERLLSEGLQAVFDDQDLRVKAEVSVNRGKVSVDLLTVQTQQDGTVIEGLSSDAFGGSVTTVQSVLLRITVILRRKQRLMLVADEALPAFDPNYIVNVGKFLVLLCDRLGLDTLLITHNPALVESVNNAYRIVKRNGAATFERLR